MKIHRVLWFLILFIISVNCAVGQSRVVSILEASWLSPLPPKGTVDQMRVWDWARTRSDSSLFYPGQYFLLLECDEAGRLAQIDGVECYDGSLSFQIFFEYLSPEEVQWRKIEQGTETKGTLVLQLQEGLLQKLSNYENSELSDELNYVYRNGVLVKKVNKYKDRLSSITTFKSGKASELIYYDTLGQTIWRDTISYSGDSAMARVYVREQHSEDYDRLELRKEDRNGNWIRLEKRKRYNNDLEYIVTRDIVYQDDHDRRIIATFGVGNWFSMASPPMFFFLDLNDDGTYDIGFMGLIKDHGRYQIEGDLLRMQSMFSKRKAVYRIAEQRTLVSLHVLEDTDQMMLPVLIGDMFGADVDSDRRLPEERYRRGIQQVLKFFHE